MSTTRRQLIGRGAGIVGAAALPGSLLAATPALGQDTDETDALEPVVELEQAAQLAYSLAAEEGQLGNQAKEAFELFTVHCDDHATALSEALDQLGADPPEAQSEPADYDQLAGFDPGAGEQALIEFMITLEVELLKAYQRLTPDLDADDLIRSAAQVGAAHAQMLVALRLLAGRPPIDVP